MMDEWRRGMLEKGVVVLPGDIDHAAYEYVLEALLLRPERVVMYCSGDGGDTGCALAIVDLITRHGDVIGMMPGSGASSCVTIWAACRERYVFPQTKVGVHKIAWSHMDTRMDSLALGVIAREFDDTERQIAGILAGASNKSVEWWLKVIQDTGSAGVTEFDAQQLIDMGMARNVRAFDALTPGPSPDGRGEKDGRDWVPGAALMPIEHCTIVPVSKNPAREEPLVPLTSDQIILLKGLGYKVLFDLNDNESGAVVRGPNWKVLDPLDSKVGYRYGSDAAWWLAWKHALEQGYSDVIKADNGNHADL